MPTAGRPVTKPTSPHHKPRPSFQRFHHIVDDGAGTVMHYHAEQAVYKARLVQVGEIAAVGKALFVNGTFIIAQKHAGHIGHNGIAIHALGKVFCLGIRLAKVEMTGKKRPLFRGNANHQCFAAVATLGAIYLRRYGIIELVYKRINLAAIPLFKE
jgi:hypothetical protein